MIILGLFKDINKQDI